MREVVVRAKRWLGQTALGKHALLPIWRFLRCNAERPAAAPQQDPLQLYAGYAPEEIVLLDAFPSVKARPELGFVVDSFGIRTRVEYFPAAAHLLDGTALGRPLPPSPPLQSDTVEYLGVLKSVITASSQFVALEVGAGWGSWLVFGGVAARHRGIERIRLYGVEADPDHVSFMRRHLQDNGFPPDEHTLIHAAVGSSGGRTRFPKSVDASADWGARPFFDRASDIDYRGLTVDATFEVEILALKDLLAREPVWDLVHIDVQGTETSLCASAIHQLGERVRYLVVGTHSRKIDGDLIDLLFRAGWDLENEKPARFAYHRDLPTLEAMTLWDGTQVWCNPRLRRSSAP